MASSSNTPSLNLDGLDDTEIEALQAQIESLKNAKLSSPSPVSKLENQFDVVANIRVEAAAKVSSEKEALAEEFAKDPSMVPSENPSEKPAETGEGKEGQDESEKEEVNSPPKETADDQEKVETLPVHMRPGWVKPTSQGKRKARKKVPPHPSEIFHISESERTPSLAPKKAKIAPTGTKYSLRSTASKKAVVQESFEEEDPEEDEEEVESDLEEAEADDKVESGADDDEEEEEELEEEVEKDLKSAKAKGKLLMELEGSSKKVSKKVVAPLVIDEEFLKGHDLEEFWELLKFQGWEKICDSGVKVDVSLLTKFFSTYQLVDLVTNSLGFSTIGTSEIFFSLGSVARILKVPSEGYGELHSSSNWPRNKAQRIKRLMGKASDAGPYSINDLSYTARIAHQFLIKVVVPRLEKRTTLTINDMILLDKFLRRECISLPAIVMRRMAKCTGKKHGLPYPQFVKAILKEKKMYKPSSEEFFGLPLDMRNISRMNFHGDSKGTTAKKTAQMDVGSSSLSEGVTAKMLFDLQKIFSQLSTVIGYLDKRDTNTATADSTSSEP